MSDLTVNVGSFTQAYREFAVEQGNSTFEAGVRAAETSDLASETKAVAVSEAGDALYITAAAAKMYAEQAQDKKQVRRRPSVGGYRDVYSSSVKIEPSDIQDRDDSHSGKSGDGDKLDE